MCAKQSRKASDVSGVSTANVAQIIQWDWNGGDSLCWLCARVAENR